MKNELFVGTLQHEPVRIDNPTFVDGMDKWAIGGTDYGYIVDNIYFFGKETEVATTTSISQTDRISKVGQYKVSFELFFQEEALGGYLDVVLGNTVYTARREKFHSVILNVTDVTNTGLFFYAKESFKGGITNIKIESADIIYSKLDLGNDTTIPINFNIADIKDFSKKNASYSKTVTLPGTATNNKFFKHIYNVNTNGAYIMNKPVPCYLLQDTQEVFVGSFELMNVTILKDNSYEYEVNIYSTFISLFTKMGNKLIVNNPNRADDIPLSEFNHIKDYNTVNNKLIANVTEYAKGGVYHTPGLNTGYDETSFDYVFIDKAGRYLDKQQPISAQQFSVSEMTATIPVKIVLDKIFEKAGYKYESVFLNSDNFKRLIMPYPDYDMVYSKSTLEKYKVTADILYNESLVRFPYINSINYKFKTYQYTDISEIVDSIVSNGGEFEAKIGGTYKYNVSGSFQIKYKTDTVPSPVPDYQDVWMSMPNTNLAFIFAGTVKLYHRRNGTVINQYTIINYRDEFNTYVDSNLQGQDYVNAVASLSNPLILSKNGNVWETTKDTFSVNETIEVAMLAGDTLDLTANIYGEPSTLVPSQVLYRNILSRDETLYVDTRVQYTIISELNNNITVNLQPIKSEGAYIYGKDIPHQNFKQADFVASLIKMFNLYVEPKNADTLIIEPRDDYYSNFGEYKDWTAKAIISKEMKIERPSDLPEKLLNIKYDSDIDWFNIEYTAGTYREYGEYFKVGEYNIDYSNKTEIKTTFAPTVCGPLQRGHKIVMPKIFDLKEGTIDKTKKHKPRILFRGDKVDYTSTGFLLMKSDLDNSKTSLFYSELPSYISHFNKPYGKEDWNLNFDAIKYNYEQETWPEGIGETWNNLFNLYYAKMINQITNTDSRLVTMYLDLKPSDIANFSFADTIRINDSVYNVNKIMDYVPTQPTKVELLKIVDVILIEKDYIVSDIIVVPPVIPTTEYLDLVEAKMQARYYVPAIDTDLIDGVAFHPTTGNPRRPSDVYIDVMDFGFKQSDDTPLSILKTYYKHSITNNTNIINTQNQNTQ